MEEVFFGRVFRGRRASEGESVTIMWGALQHAGRQGAGAVAESSHLIQSLQIKRDRQVDNWDKLGL